MKVRLLGVPTYAGAFSSGTELTPGAFRGHGLVQKLEDADINVTDLGDVSLPDYLPRHNTPPIRNYPGPRIVWENVQRSYPHLFVEGEFSLIIGGDCSLIVGTASNLHQIYGEDIHILLIDAHIDNLAPSNENCVGAAAMGLWFLTNDNMAWPKPSGLRGANFTVAGVQDTSNMSVGFNIITLERLLENGIQNEIKKLKDSLPVDKKILVHLDVDAIKKDDMPAAYIPSEHGLTLAQCSTLLREILFDDRVIGMEITEFSALKDPAGEQVEKLSRLIVDCLIARKDSSYLATTGLTPAEA
jgi:arginase